MRSGVESSSSFWDVCLVDRVSYVTDAPKNVSLNYKTTERQLKVKFSGAEGLNLGSGKDSAKIVFGTNCASNAAEGTYEDTDLGR